MLGKLTICIAIFTTIKKQLLIGLLLRYAFTVDITHTSPSLVSICVSGAESGAFPWFRSAPFVAVGIGQ